MGINNIFGGMLQEDTMREGKDINSSIMKVNIFLAITAAILSLIGMYNLVALDILRRTKEMGIRKIQGASIPLIMFMISKKFLIVLVIASVIGCAGGYYMSNMLMGSIWQYFVKIKPGILILSASIMFVATTLTIIFKIGKSALRNPVDSLRYE
jgi:ABC-type antimicrobial peptide transport system permease subunit